MFTRHTTPSASTFFAALLAVGLLLPGGTAQAQTGTSTCGLLNNGMATCGNQAWPSGILYESGSAFTQGVITDIAITVTGGANTRITAPPNRATWREGGIVLRTDGRVGGSKDIALMVGSGANDGNAVVIQEHSSNSNHGVYLQQDSGGVDDTTVTLGSGVRIGGTTARMRLTGVQIIVQRAANTGVHTINSAATIHSTSYGLHVVNRGAGEVAVTNSGTITTPATGGNSGIRIEADTPVNTRNTPTTVTNSGSVTVATASRHGIYVDAKDRSLYKITNSGTVSVSGAGGHGIYVDARLYKGGEMADTDTVDGGIEVENSGSGERGITASGTGFSTGIYVEASGATGTDDITIRNSGDITSTHIAILVNSDMGAVTVTASDGDITSTSNDGIAIQQNADADMTVTSGADVTAGMRGIRVQAVPVADDTSTPSTDESTTPTTGNISITTTGGSIEAESPGMDGIWPQDHAYHTGTVTISNAASITADRYGIYANRLGAGAVSVTNTGGTVLGKTQSGIYVWNKVGEASDVTVEVEDGTVRSEGKSTPAISAGNRGTGDVTVTIAAPEGDSEAMPTLGSMYNAGVYTELPGADNTGKIAITQGGTIMARKGVYARVGRASAESETRAADDQPLIDVTWSGTFSHGTAADVSQDDAGRYVAASAAHAIHLHREVETEKTIRYGSPAGIEAQVMSRRAVMAEVATGDAPAAVAADNAAQLLLVPTGATAADNDYVAAFKAALTNPDIEVPAAVLTAIGSAATTAAGVTDAEIVTYLQGDTADRRTLLRNVLAQGLSEKEKAVLRAVVTDTGLDAALDDTEAGFSMTYKDAVKALLENHNVGDIRVAMTGGSIASRGDGIRAYYATPHDMNGAIEVTVAEGATVTGGNAGIYVANAGEGLMLARKYTYGYAMGDDPDEVVAVMHGEGADAVPLRDQLVTVAGMVTGGTDAAVHLSGGGAVLVMEGGKVHAGASGVGILVNDPGPALIYVGGEVRGGAGGTAAVHLTGGGSVIVGLNGRVLANGAAHAIRSDGEEETTLTLATSRMTPYREDVEEQVEGSVEGVGNNVRYREEQGGVPTGYSGTLPIGDNGMVDVSGLPRRPVPPPPAMPTDSTGDGVRVDTGEDATVEREDGIRVSYEEPRDDNEAIHVEVRKDERVTGSMAGIYVANAGTGLMLARRYTPGFSKGDDPDEVVAVTYGEGADAVPLRDQLVTVAGTVTGGTDAAVHLDGGGAVLVHGGGRVHAGASGVGILVNDPGPAVVYVDGEVKGGAGGAAAVHLTGGGAVIVGLNGRVQANGADHAIRSDGEAVTTLILVAERMDPYQEDVNAQVGGTIEGIASARLREDDQNGVPTGYSRPLRVTRSGRLDVSGLPSRSTFSCAEAGDGRCRLYEALPSMLVAMNGLPSYAERTSAARDGNGGWARVETVRGEWQAKKAVTSGKLAYDHHRNAGRVGVDYAVREDVRIGASAHALRGKAEMAGVGEVDLDGMGVGVSATWMAGDLYVDAQAATTWYDADFKSNAFGRLKKDTSGAGYALGVDVGRRMAMGELLVTPRGGFVWSKTDLDNFMDDYTGMATGDSPGRAQVSVEDAGSMKGRLGVMVETEVGMGATSGHLFGSLDVEREFSDETEMKVGGQTLKTEVRPTTVRLGLGGVFDVDENILVRATAGWQTSGSGTSGYGGGLELHVHF